jgi:hypothetical protein
MKEREKASEMYDYALKLHGPEKAKEESLRSAKAIYSLAPYNDGKMKNRTYWEKVIEYLKKK